MGFDKAELFLGNKTFAERAVISLRAVAPENIYLIGNNPKYSVDLPVLPDLIKKNSRGSIIGLYTALFHTKSEWTAVLACDLPFVTGELFKRLASFITEDFDAVVPKQPDGKIQPLCALYRRNSCLIKVEEMLKEENWKLKVLTDRLKTRFVEFDFFRDMSCAEQLFFNVNTPEDYEKVKQIFAEENQIALLDKPLG